LRYDAQKPGNYWKFFQPTPTTIEVVDDTFVGAGRYGIVGNS
jgi:hypothetical protein